LLEILNTFKNISGIAIDIIVVDDHSSDGTFKQVQDINDSRVDCLRLSRRSGSHVALRAGLRAVTGDATICIPADGQEDPKFFKQMLAKWAQGAQVVWALAVRRSNEPTLQRLFAHAYYRMLLGKSIYGLSTEIDYSRASFYLLDRVVVEAINSCPERNTSLFGLIAWLGFLQDSVDYQRRDRLAGASKWNFKSRLRLAKDWLLGFSDLPLRLISWLAAGVTAVGLLLGSGLGLSALLGQSPAGWAYVLALALLLGGVQLLVLAVLAEYQWRNLDEARRRPLYFIEARLGRGKPGGSAPQ